MSSVNHAESSGASPARGSPSATAALMATVDRGIGSVCRVLLYLTMAIVFAILSINVGLRYVAGTSLSWASELPELLFPWMIVAGVVLAAQHGSHIAVVIVTKDHNRGLVFKAPVNANIVMQGLVWWLGNGHALFVKIRVNNTITRNPEAQNSPIIEHAARR